MKTLYTNAIFHTMEDPHDIHHSMTVEDGLITAFDEESDTRCRTIDLNGVHVYPAMIDAHLHMMSAIALSSLGVPLCRFENNGVEPHDLNGIGEMIRAHAANQKPGSLMVFNTYISSAINERRLPTRHELDEWTNGARVWVLNIDGHSSSASTALLTALGLAEVAPDGIFSGSAHDANMGTISDYLASSITPKNLASGVADFCNECASFGIGTVCAMEGTDDSTNDSLTGLIAFLAQGFPLDVRLFPQYMDEAKLKRVLPRMAEKRVGGCMKWELDGSIGSRTAAFARPYKDGSQTPLYFEHDVIAKTVEGFAQRGFFISVHAIGELAIDQIVGILEGVAGRHRIDHCEFPSPDILSRIYELKPFVTVQPGYSWIDKRYMHGYERFLDDAMLMQQVPLKDFAANDVPLCGSSDAPVQSVDPYLQMRGMREFYVEDQSLSAFEALKSYTVNGGLMLGENKGLLRQGYEASFFTTTSDLLAIEPSGLENVRATSLYLKGKRHKPLSRGLWTLIRVALSPSRILKPKLL
ncbi:MAG: amidohydrolase family protein [Coriobacteriia bacterium]|nr:amidohydrolase family protein [Coriobacteriia bacterium]